MLGGGAGKPVTNFGCFGIIVVVQNPQLGMEGSSRKIGIHIFVADFARDASLVQEVLQEPNLRTLWRGEKHFHDSDDISLFLPTDLEAALASVRGKLACAWNH